MSAPEMDDPLLGARTIAELETLLSAQPVHAGQVVDATVTAVADEQVTVEIAEAGSADIRAAEFRLLGESVAVGDAVRVYVDWVTSDGSLQLSRQKANGLDLWSTLVNAAANRSPIKATVLAQADDGFTVDIGTKAFVAGRDLGAAARQGEDLVGQTIELYVLNTDARKARVRLAGEPPKGSPAQRLDPDDDIFDQLEDGQSLVGRVARITDFGGFVDIGGFDGLLHVNDMSWGRVNHPSDVVQVGDEVIVKVLKIDEDNRRVGLGLKQLQPDPWSIAAERYTPDLRVSGRVISVAAYGAFVEVEPGLEGLVHVSEMAWTRVQHPKDVVRKGQLVEAAVIRCDPSQQRLKLSMKALLPNPWQAVAEQYPPGTNLTGKIRSVTDFGIFVGVAEGIDGLVHISDLAWGNSVRRPSDAFRKGQEVETLVLEVDVERERMSLGVKQLTPDPTAAFFNSHAEGDTIEGTVTGLAEFGAFVRVADGLDGLVHISELSHEEIERPSDAVKKGDTVRVVILSLDPDTPKISLSRKVALPEPGDEPAAEATPDDNVDAANIAPEAAPEPPAEAAPEPPAEAAPEPPAEAAPEPPAEAAPEPPAEAAPEPPAEAVPEGNVDAANIAPEAAPEPAAETSAASRLQAKLAAAPEAGKDADDSADDN